MISCLCLRQRKRERERERERERDGREAVKEGRVLTVVVNPDLLHADMTNLTKLRSTFVKVEKLDRHK